MTGLNKASESFSSAPDLIATHRARYIKNDAHRNGSIIVTEECNVLRLFVVQNSKCVLIQARNIAAVRISNSDRERDKISVNDHWSIQLFASLLRLRRWFGCRLCFAGCFFLSSGSGGVKDGEQSKSQTKKGQGLIEMP